MAKNSYRYVKKKYKTIYIKDFCAVCEQGFKIWRWTRKYTPNSTSFADKLYDGFCIGGHSMCANCIESWYGEFACEEHNHLI